MSRRIIAAAIFMGLGASLAHADVPVGENTTVGGSFFIDLTDISQKSGNAAGTNEQTVTPSGTGIDVKRAYLIVNHTFDSVWSANLTTDAQFASKTTETNAQDVFIKKIYVQAKVSDAFWAKLGSAEMPWIPYVEAQNNLRYTENMFIDRAKFGTTTDWGLHVGGDLAGKRVSYAVSIVNGGEFKNPQRTNSMDVEARLSAVVYEGLSAAVGFYTGKNGKDVQATAGNPPSAAPTVYHTASRVDALLSYVNSRARIGVEYFSADNWKNETTKASEKADGYSGWASYNFLPTVGVFARYDRMKPTKNTNALKEDKFFDVGITCSPRKNVDLALLYKHESVNGGQVTVAEGTLGGFTATTGSGTYSEAGLWAQVKF